MRKASAWRLLTIGVWIGVVTVTATAQDKWPVDVFNRLSELHEVKRPPGPYDWLAVHPEPGQTVAAFLHSKPTKPKPGEVIVVQPLGEFSAAQRAVIERTAAALQAFFQMPVRIEKEMPLDEIPSHARRIFEGTGRPQILTTYILDHLLIPNKPDDAFCVLALTAVDLWPGEGWNFVFGQADVIERVGVWSMARNGDPNRSREEFETVTRRTISTALHETGHLFGLWHCPFYECLMNGSNHRQESDARPLWLCPIDLRKMVLLLEWDLAKRFGDLKLLYEKWGWHKEAAFYQRCLDIVRNGVP